jgi:hypothetical protein
VEGTNGVNFNKDMLLVIGVGADLQNTVVDAKE